jgi:YD repeat-containing protein
VAIDGNTIVIGANEDDDNGSNSGSAYIFEPAFLPDQTRLVSIRDPQGNETILSYDINGRLERVTDPSGTRYLDFDYNGDDLLTTVTDHTNRSVGYGYDSDDNLTVVTDTRSLNWTYTYTRPLGSSETPHLMHEIIEPAPGQRVVERNYYDAEGRTRPLWLSTTRMTPPGSSPKRVRSTPIATGPTLAPSAARSTRRGMSGFIAMMPTSTAA